jgi:RNA polymerase sigma-70 factor (ECF subfamily)
MQKKAAAGRIVKLIGSVHFRSSWETRTSEVDLSEREPIPDEGDRDDVESTLELLKRAHGGDRAALEVLVERCLPPLRRWAHGRLPQFARDEFSTEDLVQEAILRVLRRLKTFEARHVGALQAFLRQTVKNLICDEIRRTRHRTFSTIVPEDVKDEQVSALEALIAKESVEHYESAMKRLPPLDRELIVARFEMGLAFDDVAVATGKPTAAAARIAVIRAMNKLAEELNPASRTPA